jgi:hypothetical protein
MNLPMQRTSLAMAQRELQSRISHRLMILLTKKTVALNLPLGGTP